MQRTIATAAALILTGAMACSSPPPPAEPPPPPPATPAPQAGGAPNDAIDIAALEREAMRRLNEYRVSQGMAPFRFDSRLSALAREHSQHMASGQVGFGHTGFAQRVARSGHEADAAENVVYTPDRVDPASDVMKLWIASPGHLEKIRGKRLVSGVGAAEAPNGKIYVTQIFFRN